MSDKKTTGWRSRTRAERAGLDRSPHGETSEALFLKINRNAAVIRRDSCRCLIACCILYLDGKSQLIIQDTDLYCNHCGHFTSFDA